MAISSLRIVPADTHATTFTHLKNSSAPSAPGLHDTLRAGVGPSPHESGTHTVPISAHPLESRLKNWETTQHNLRMELLRRVYGAAEPIRRAMELHVVEQGEWRPIALGGASGLHSDILRGRDEMITWEDVFSGEENRAAVDVHDEMERKVRM